MDFDTFDLDGVIVGTGLQLPNDGLVSAFPVYADAGPMLTMDTILDIAKSGARRGRDRFDSSFIKDQNGFGACQGFASAGAVTRARIRRGLTRVDLSGAYAYSLVNGGRDSGSQLESGMRACAERGYASEALVGNRSIYRGQYDTAKADADAARYKAFEVYAVRTEIELFSALALGFDCVVAVHANDGFMRLDSRGVAGGGQGRGNHSVSSDGLTFDRELIADGYNSWAVRYGDAGRMGLTWNQHFANTTPYHVFYAIRSATDDPSGENPPPVKE